MACKRPTKPRKNASQQRSRATVDALVEATARILVREGFEKASTNRIAEIAGVSVGSLYQYFPSKEALVAAVIDRHNAEIMGLVRAALTEVAELPIEKAVRKLVTVAIEAHRIDPKLHRVLAEQIPRTGQLKDVEAFNREVHTLVRAYLESRRKEMRKIDPGLFKQNFEEAVWMGQSAKRLIDALSLWKANEGNGDEGFWQTSLRESSYIFSQLFSVPVTFIQGRAYVGGQQIDGRNARLVDFLLSGGSSGEAILIEIKTPTTPLIQKSKYRTSIHAPSSDLSGAIVQAADYRNCVLREIRGVTQDRPSDLSTFNPKAIVIVGNYTSELDSDEKRRSFELYRTSLSNIEIITFDELFGKIEHLAKLFNLVKTNESGASPQGAKEH